MNIITFPRQKANSFFFCLIEGRMLIKRHQRCFINSCLEALTSRRSNLNAISYIDIVSKEVRDETDDSLREI